MSVLNKTVQFRVNKKGLYNDLTALWNVSDHVQDERIPHSERTNIEINRK